MSRGFICDELDAQKLEKHTQSTLAFHNNCIYTGNTRHDSHIHFTDDPHNSTQY